MLDPSLDGVLVLVDDADTADDLFDARTYGRRARPNGRGDLACRPPTRRARLTGIALMCGAVGCFAFLDADAKYLGSLPAEIGNP